MSKKGAKEKYANIHIIVSPPTKYSLEETLSLAKLKKIGMELMAELQKTFPEATEDFVGMSRIRGGDMHGFIILVWNDTIEPGEYPGWIQDNESCLPYTW